MKLIKLGSRFISKDSLPYVIAEIGVNHEGDFSEAIKLIDSAKRGGADAVKFQSYKAKTLASKNSPSYWDTSKEKTKSQYQLFKKYDNFEKEDYEKLAKYSNSIGIDFLSTPFDSDSIDYLENIIPFYKIASADITNIPFLRKIASKGKPVVLSTGASTITEIDIALNTLKEFELQNIIILHCILNYPTPDRDANLMMIKGLIHSYPEYLIGYSDHTLPDKNMTTLLSSFLLGAVVIEKHFTLDKTKEGNDHYHAMDEKDLNNFINIVKKTKTLLGKNFYKKPIKEEEISRLNARRSIVLLKNMNKGEIICESNITYKRPGFGISPIFWDKVIGKKVTKDLNEDHILDWDDIK
tara:strand:+ start:947 stop:2005 length:1059 start_codon:yes stop_codon:yes gene_type:complete